MADKFAVITGASTGIGAELAKLAASDGHDLLVVADTPFVDAAAGLHGLGVEVRTLEVDLDFRRRRQAAGGRWRKAYRSALCQCRARSWPCLSRAGSGAMAPRAGHELHRHTLPASESARADGRAQRRQGAGDGLDRRFHSRQFQRRLQRHQGLRGQFHRGAAKRDQGERRRHPDHIDAGSGRNRVLLRVAT